MFGSVCSHVHVGRLPFLFPLALSVLFSSRGSSSQEMQDLNTGNGSPSYIVDDSTRNSKTCILWQLASHTARDDWQCIVPAVSPSTRFNAASPKSTPSSSLPRIPSHAATVKPKSSHAIQIQTLFALLHQADKQIIIDDHQVPGQNNSAATSSLRSELSVIFKNIIHRLRANCQQQKGFQRRSYCIQALRCVKSSSASTGILLPYSIFVFNPGNMHPDTRLRRTNGDKTFHGMCSRVWNSAMRAGMGELMLEK
ncbi:hypothetical protein FB451DRAFT_1452180 [Mycena latifolia]|nr:hypothetical protein FB451DRAFT_1452180 [Mycena latifolia]